MTVAVHPQNPLMMPKVFDLLLVTFYKKVSGDVLEVAKNNHNMVCSFTPHSTSFNRT